MRCLYCKCETQKQSTMTHVVTLANSIIVVKNVPCVECDQCGAKFYLDNIVSNLEEIVNKAKELSSEVIVTEYKVLAVA
ncbi:MAG: YgiT-type zinc finger protein [Lachnospiraceae bacterium]|nr:YgiT-type zinc finger protein [Lachnospiraceae bacterium]